LNRHVNLGETINEDTMIHVANSLSPSSPSILTRTSIVRNSTTRKLVRDAFTSIPPQGDAQHDPADAKATMPAGRKKIKAPIFGGTDLEGVTNWIWKMETYLRTSRVPAEQSLYNAVFALTGDADNFIYSLVLKKGSDLTWDEFKAVMIERYDKTAIRALIFFANDWREFASKDLPKWSTTALPSA
jgi:hypothetical protein